MQRCAIRLVMMIFGVTVAASANANDWGNLAVISDTLGNHAGRICVGEGLRVSDIGCPTYAPSITTAGDVSVTGNLSANKFIGDGSGLTGVGQSDRITSGTTRIIANNNSYISVTVNGIDVARFNQLQGAVFGANGALNTGYWAGSSVSTTATFLRNGDSFVSIRSLDNAGNAGLLFYGAGYRGTIYGTPSYDLYISPNDQYARADVIFKPVLGTNGMNVGINTDAPQATLQVSGSLIVSTSAQTTTPSLYVGTNGNVGIGTSGPAYQLQVNAPGGGANALVLSANGSARVGLGAVTTGGYGSISLGSGQSIAWGNGTDFATTKDVGLVRHGTGVLRVSGLTANETGTLLAEKLGIGTATPTVALEVSGSARVSGTVKIDRQDGWQGGHAVAGAEPMSPVAASVLHRASAGRDLRPR